MFYYNKLRKKIMYILRIFMYLLYCTRNEIVEIKLRKKIVKKHIKII